MTYEPIDPTAVNTNDLGSRKSLVSVESFGRPCERGSSFATWLDSLPDVLGARHLRALAADVVEAHRRGKPVVLSMGAHVIKCGLTPIVCDLMERGLVTALAMNGACLVHDVELAIAGKTSEDVGEALPSGSFGMTSQTADLINEAATRGAEDGVGLGEAVGRALLDVDPPHASTSVLCAGVRLHLPLTVHVAIGTDVVHMHPSADGAAIGTTSLSDFRLLTSVVADLGGGGVFINVGSAVILPEVFLKCLSLARNLGHDVRGFTTANLDFIQHYRAAENLLARPVSDPDSRSYAITGHHEILVPLLAQALLEELG